MLLYHVRVPTHNACCELEAKEGAEEKLKGEEEATTYLEELFDGSSTTYGRYSRVQPLHSYSGVKESFDELVWS